ncbi:thromboxane A synthase [Elysia marginata]|uniref:Thromboxane A synthase n=1 Tax=Elysia marginata TaxID=1093978 RepID=A0AAV4FUD2_9GAST|nr:thromboxane A synthase [Elysia marginata]
MAEAFRQWVDQYGPVVGVYFMRRPMLVVSDVNMLKQILVTDFHNFTNRGVWAIAVSSRPENPTLSSYNSLTIGPDVDVVLS